jgi:hypothetical protein
MAVHKLMLDDDFEEEYSLLAIHCSEEPYKMAYLLNQHATLRLKRRDKDLHFEFKNGASTFPFFEYENEQQYIAYSLVANKCISQSESIPHLGELFNDGSPEMVIQFLIPEYDKVDYLLKIYSDFELIPMRKIVAAINEIKQVISAYSIDAKQLKSKNNLIFN